MVLQRCLGALLLLRSLIPHFESFRVIGGGVLSVWMRLRSFGLAKHFSVFFFVPVSATLISWRDMLRSLIRGSTHREFHAKLFLNTLKLLGFCIENNIATVASSSSFGNDVSCTETGVL